MEIEKKLLDNNNEFLKLFEQDQNKKQRYQDLVKGQHPYALIITCSDSRVIPEEIFNVGPGELFVIRTAGNVINEGELATVEYAIEHLKVKYVLVLGHTHCGAVHASIHKEHGQYIDVILNRIRKSIGDECDEMKASKKNALAEVEFIKSKFPQYDGDVKAGLYDIETNKVTIL